MASPLRTDPILKDIPAIIVTATADPKLNVKGFQAGTTLATQKPYEPQKLSAAVRTSLALKAKCPTSGTVFGLARRFVVQSGGSYGNFSASAKRSGLVREWQRGGVPWDAQ